MAVINVEARLVSASGATAQGGLRMCVEATIRRPKPPEGFGRPNPPPAAPDAPEGPSGAKEG